MTREEILVSKIKDLKKDYDFLLRCQEKNSIGLSKAIEEGNEKLISYYRVLIEGDKEDLDKISLEISNLEKEIPSSEINWLNLICKKFNLTRYAIEKKTGVRQSMLSRIVNNDIHYSKVEFRLILRLSVMIGMTLDEFYEELKKLDKEQ